MKLSKIIKSGRALWESFRGPQCNNGRNSGQDKQNATRKLKDEKKKPTKLEVKKPVVNVQRANILKDNNNQKTRCTKYDIDKKQRDTNIENTNGKKMRKVSSKIVFRRQFSKYNDVEHKLNADFKSSYKNSGRFDPSWSRYKAYVNKNQNQKNKSYLKHAMCDSSARGNSKKKCPDLPGKGTYNHRMAYDEALQLHRQGVDVDVLYKVKNKTDSVYVISGEFLHTNDTQFGQNAQTKTSRKRNKDNAKHRKLVKSQAEIEEDALWLAELAKIQKQKEGKAAMLANIASIQKAKDDREAKEKRDRFDKYRKIQDADKKFRAEQLRKMTDALALKERKLQKERNKKEKLQVGTIKQRETDLPEQLELTEIKRLRRLKMQQNLLAYRNNKNVVNNPLENMEPAANALGEFEVITDPNIINDVERWALHNNGTLRAVSWLKLVAGRIESLDGRVDQSHRNKWMRAAIDRVIDQMVREKSSSDFRKRGLSDRKSLCNRKAKVSSSFVIKSKRTAVRCHCEHAAFGLHKSPKFAVCPHRNKTYKLIKTAGEGSYFQVISVDAFGLGCCAADRNKERTDYYC